MNFGWAFGGLVVGSALVFTIAAGCSDGKAPVHADAGTGAITPSGYTPQGCQYTVSIPERLALKDVNVVDDPSAVGSAPLRVRIGLGGGVTAGAPGYADPVHTASFTWETADATKATKIRFGTSDGAFTETRTGYSWTTPTPEIGLGTNEPETYMHEVHVCGLVPNTKYFYQVGGGAPEVWSTTQSFTTLPDTGKITVGILGDARDKVDVWRLVERRVKAAGAQIQLTSGDLVFVGAQESLIANWLDAIWKDPDKPGDFITLGQQMMVMIGGNHEGEAARFYAAFSMPGEGPYAETGSSFDIGNTHFVMVDDQPIAGLEGSEEGASILKWLEADLAKADTNRAKVPFVACISHRGLYTTSNHAIDGDVKVARKLLAPIYDKYHVDLVVNGHDHIFERTKPLHAGADPAGDPVVQAPGQGTVYVVNAGAGADPYRVGIYPAAYREKSEQFGSGTPYVGFYGIVTLEDRKLTFNSYGLTTMGPDPIVDTFELTK